MRRLLLIVSGIVLVALLAAGFRRAWLEHQASHREITLGDGTILRVEGLTWGTNQTLRLEPAWWSELKRRLPSAWQARIGVPLETRALLGDSSAHLWLSRYDPAQNNYPNVNVDELTTFDATGFAHDSSSSSGFGAGRASLALDCPVLDWRAEFLRFQLKTGREVHEFSLPNPRRGERFPEWTPKPLPQTVQAGEFAFSLGQLQRFSPARPEWHPKLAVARGERDATEWFNSDMLFVDPTGNRHPSALPATEPVWGVEVTAYPSAQFPFPEERAVPLGRLTVPAPGGFAILPSSAIATNACLHWAAFAGSGNFAFRRGTNEWARPPRAGSGGNSSTLGGDFWRLATSYERPSLCLLLRGPIRGGGLLPAENSARPRIVARARREDGTILEGSSRGYTSSHDGKTITRIMSIEFATAIVGEQLNVDLFLSDPLLVNFTFAAPSSK